MEVKSYLPNFIKAQSENGLRLKLRQLQLARGANFKVITIYKEGKNVVAWYYDYMITPDDVRKAEGDE